MSASSVIAGVTETLQELLIKKQQPKGSFEVSLASPADEKVDDTAKPKVNLFLFRVTENPFAKNQDWLPAGIGNLHYPPLALNLFYVLTPFAFNKLDEHRVLGEAMRVLYEDAIISAPLLKGALEHTSEEIKVDLCQLTIEDLTRIWNALNKPYRLSVCYEVRILLIDSVFEQPVPRVLEKEMQYFQIVSK